MPDTYYTVAAIAKTLQTSSDTVLRLIRAGRIRATNAGLSERRPRWIVAEGDLQDFLRRRQNLPSETPAAPRRKRRSKPADYVEYF